VTSVDLNADLGESFGAWTLGDDEALLDVVTSANVACGFHAGDPRTMARTVAVAARRGVRIGAQVSYPDLVGFGRRRMDVDAETLTADVLYQLGALHAMCVASGTAVAYLKPHGALYNRIVDDEQQAAAVVAALQQWPDAIPLMTLPESVASSVAARAGIAVIREGFADRAYTDSGRLVPRSDPGAVLTDPDDIASHVVRLVNERGVESICVHGDTPGAVAIARAVRAALEAAGVKVRA
jgi:UPF0271 protein